MFFLLAFLLVLASTHARPLESFVAVTQNTNGSYDFKYVAPGIARAENKDAFGNVIGAFSFVDPEGVVRETQFTSGVDGYHAFGPDIPVPVQDTPEVALAKFQHLAVLNAAYLRLPADVHF